MNNTRLIFNKDTGMEIYPQREAIQISLMSESKHTWIFDSGALVPTLTADIPKRVRLTNDIIYDRVTRPETLSGNMNDIVTAIKKGSLIGGSYASVKSERSVGAWKFQVQGNQTGLTEEGLVNGDPQTMHSTRGERGITTGALWTTKDSKETRHQLMEIHPAHR